MPKTNSFSLNRTINKSGNVFNRGLYHLLKYKMLYLMLTPGVIFLFIFCYLPMSGVVIAFQTYYPWNHGFLGGKWIGFTNFIDFFTGSAFLKLLKNTLIITFFKLLTSFPLTIILALLLNEIRNNVFKRVVQTVSYLPYFISWVIVAGIAYNFFSTDVGFINITLKNLGLQPVNWYTRPDLWRGILVVTNLWKGIGWGTIIYLAAIAGINSELYEAAIIDGANKFRQAWHITIPGIVPIISITLILSMGSFIKEDFSQIFALIGSNSILYKTTDVFETYIFRTSMSATGEYGMTTAIGLFQSVFSLVMVLGANYFAKKTGNEGIW